MSASLGAAERQKENPFFLSCFLGYLDERVLLTWLFGAVSGFKVVEFLLMVLEKSTLK